MSKSIHNETYKQKTGKLLTEWIEELDSHQATDWSHKQLVTHLVDKHNLEEWWAQTIVVEYEKHHGKRVLGETQDAGFEVGIQRTFPIDATELWELLVSPEGTDVWLGEGVEIPLVKGQVFSAAGSTYEIRSLKDGEKLRLRKSSTGHSATTIQLYVTPKKEKSALLIHHEKLQDQSARNEMKTHWQSVLDKLQSYTNQKGEN
jgi:uncharacterized protein YndB with AHSA1/START domain